MRRLLRFIRWRRREPDRANALLGCITRLEAIIASQNIAIRELRDEVRRWERASIYSDTGNYYRHVDDSVRCVR